MTDISEILKKLLEFRDARNWEQFHKPKDLAIALSIEASELLELFLWKNSDEADINKVKDEIADVIAYTFLLANHYNFDLKKIVFDKIKKNEIKYPIEKSFNNSSKYNDL